MKLNINKKYNVSKLSQDEKITLGKFIYKNIEKDDIWLSNRYWEGAKSLHYDTSIKEWVISYSSEGDDKVEIEDDLTWRNREKFRNKWFKRKDREEESMVRHLWNRKNTITGEMEFIINGITAEQFKKEFEWI